MTHFLECFCVEVSLLCRNGTVSKLHCVEMTGIRSNCSLTSTQMPCFICGQVGEKTWSFHKASTFDVSNKVWLCALKTKNYTLAANSVENETEMNKEEREAKELAFIELIDLIETYWGTGVTLPMSKVVAAHEKRLKSLNVQLVVHTSRLRQQLLDHIPNLTAIQASDHS